MYFYFTVATWREVDLYNRMTTNGRVSTTDPSSTSAYNSMKPEPRRGRSYSGGGYPSAKSASNLRAAGAANYPAPLTSILIILVGALVGVLFVGTRGILTGSSTLHFLSTGLM